MPVKGLNGALALVRAGALTVVAGAGRAGVASAGNQAYAADLSGNGVLEHSRTLIQAVQETHSSADAPGF